MYIIYVVVLQERYAVCILSGTPFPYSVCMLRYTQTKTKTISAGKYTPTLYKGLYGFVRTLYDM